MRANLRGTQAGFVLRRLATVGEALGRLLLVYGAVLALPAVVALCYRETGPALAFAEVGLLTAAGGWALHRWLPRGRLGTREAVLMCTGAWVVCSALGAVPLWLSCHLPYSSALFECVSGLTTTGMTILSQIAGQSRTLLFWRSLSQLLGGLGILSFFLLVSFPGSAAHRLFATEGSKTGVPRPTPSLRRTVMITWGLYGLLLVLNLVALLLLGCGGFDSLNYAFTTVSTGGFATHELGVGYFHAIGHPRALGIELATMVFMALSGLNFLLHYRALTGRVVTLFAGHEARRYWLLMLVVGALITVEAVSSVGTWEWLGQSRQTGDIGGGVGLMALRLAAFQAVSVTSSAGHLTLPLQHPFFGAAARQAFLFLIMVGGCVGSTAGGIKVLRVLLLGRSLGQEVRKLCFPENAALPVVVDGSIIPTAAIQPIAAMVFAWIVLALAGGMYLALCTSQGAFECLTLSMSALSNIGPSLMPSGVLPTLPLSCQVLLMVWMIAGRLEVLPVLALFVPHTWRQ